RNVYGLASPIGASSTDSPIAITIVAAANRQAFLTPSRAASIAVNTGTAGQAVAFMAAATPRAPAARISPDGLAISARVRNISAMTGGGGAPPATREADHGGGAMKTEGS